MVLSKHQVLISGPLTTSYFATLCQCHNLEQLLFLAFNGPPALELLSSSLGNIPVAPVTLLLNENMVAGFSPTTPGTVLVGSFFFFSLVLGKGKKRK